jgi:predicted GIY-YIG superfamily endonuclease
VARVTIGQALLENRPHVLYRLSDRTDVLLYVGITADFTQRMAAHERERAWWPQVDRAATRIEYYDCRSAALDAEREAIKAENPLHNDQHNQRVEVPEPSRYSWPVESFVDLILDGVGEQELDDALHDTAYDLDGRLNPEKDHRNQAAFYILIGAMQEHQTRDCPPAAGAEPAPAASLWGS